jgi:hypothetical protein
MPGVLAFPYRRRMAALDASQRAYRRAVRTQDRGDHSEPGRHPSALANVNTSHRSGLGGRDGANPPPRQARHYLPEIRRMLPQALPQPVFRPSNT